MVKMKYLFIGILMLIIAFRWVQNEAGMKAYVIARNSTVVLWDFENPVIYISFAAESFRVLPIIALKVSVALHLSQQPLHKGGKK